MQIAIIGAGFCGLATAWHMLQAPSLSKTKITLIDSRGIGQGASGISAGLLHPFSGAHAKLNWKGREGMKATRELLNIASETIGRPVTAKKTGILRLALSIEQKRDFQLCADRYPLDTRWLDALACKQLAPGAAEAPGLLIEGGLTIYSALYLEGLWKACAMRGAQFCAKKIKSLQDVSHYDVIILATGAESLSLPEASELPLSCVKGQVLELAWPHDCPPFSCPLNSHVYLLMTEDGKSCLAGATYEKGYHEAHIDVESAKREILPKVHMLFPPLEGAKVVNCFAGMRAVTPQHRPIMQRLSKNQWILTGMGSKGLLYHSLFAKMLVEDIIRSI